MVLTLEGSYILIMCFYVMDWSFVRLKRIFLEFQNFAQIFWCSKINNFQNFNTFTVPVLFELIKKTFQFQWIFQTFPIKSKNYLRINSIDTLHACSWGEGVWRTNPVKNSKIPHDLQTKVTEIPSPTPLTFYE